MPFKPHLRLLGSIPLAGTMKKVLEYSWASLLFVMGLWMSLWLPITALGFLSIVLLGFGWGFTTSAIVASGITWAIVGLVVIAAILQWIASWRIWNPFKRAMAAYEALPTFEKVKVFVGSYLAVITLFLVLAQL